MHGLLYQHQYPMVCRELLDIFESITMYVRCGVAHQSRSWMPLMHLAKGQIFRPFTARETDRVLELLHSGRLYKNSSNLQAA